MSALVQLAVHALQEPHEFDEPVLPGVVGVAIEPQLPTFSFQAVVKAPTLSQNGLPPIPLSLPLPLLLLPSLSLLALPHAAPKAHSTATMKLLLM
ncbi:MAG: hypothetical protein A2V77_23540 [Anaeromyxobacter sp. RBG_16_69_14]|nr:MAG: hypothetical protein A2V77_23540 [Anaeromyxobacter sp. RBG_16_69_14]